MTFWTYLFVNTVLSLTVTAILIWTKPENRAKRAEAKMRHEEDLFNMILEAAKRIDEERKPNQDFTPPPTRHSGGNSELDELQERVKDLADRLDRAEKKPVTPERLKEAGFETEKVRVFDPAEKRWTYREVVKNSKCSDCKHWKKETCSSVGRCEVLDRPTKWYERGCQLFDKWEPPIQTTHICRNCKHYLATDEEYLTGTCGLNEEITFANSTKACFESKPSTSIVRPKPLGTITTH